MGPKREALRDAGLLLLRLLMGAGITVHGYSKLFGGMETFTTEMVAGLGLPFLAPETYAHLAAWAEFAGGILIALGLLTRVAAFAVFVDMTVAAFVFHAHDPFARKELALAYWAMAAALALAGAGRWSLDAAVVTAAGKGKSA